MASPLILRVLLSLGLLGRSNDSRSEISEADGSAPPKNPCGKAVEPMRKLLAILSGHHRSGWTIGEQG